MRALDGFLDKQVRDINHDRNLTSRALLTESNSLAWLGAAAVMQDRLEHKFSAPSHDKPLQDHRHESNEKQHNNSHDHKESGMGQRDKMALASIAFCSPLMLLSMGATMAIMDDMKINRDARINQSLRNRLQMRQGRIVTEENKEVAPRRSLSMTFDATGRMRVEAAAIKPKKEKTCTRPDKPVKVFPMPEKSWLKASKLLKQKQALVDLLEKGRGHLQLSKVSALVSKIEELDKELKKVGC
jgi:hypothetical protein